MGKSAPLGINVNSTMVLDQLFAMQSIGSGVAMQGIVKTFVSVTVLLAAKDPVAKAEHRSRPAYFMVGLVVWSFQ